jgi:hypothetical protein
VEPFDLFHQSRIAAAKQELGRGVSEPVRRGSQSIDQDVDIVLIDQLRPEPQ